MVHDNNSNRNCYNLSSIEIIISYLYFGYYVYILIDILVSHCCCCGAQGHVMRMCARVIDRAAHGEREGEGGARYHTRKRVY